MSSADADQAPSQVTAIKEACCGTRMTQRIAQKRTGADGMQRLLHVVCSAEAVGPTNGDQFSGM